MLQLDAGAGSALFIPAVDFAVYKTEINCNSVLCRKHSIPEHELSE